MCGRIACTLAVDELCCATAMKSNGEYVKTLSDSSLQTSYIPNSNIPPTATVPVLVSREQKIFGFQDDDKTDRMLVPMRFGLIPPWKTKGSSETHLCRLETLKTSKLFSPQLEQGKRCAIPCLGYYEWQSTLQIKHRQPYLFFHKDNDTEDLTKIDGTFSSLTGWNGVKLLYLAGIYREHEKDGVKTYSFAIITRGTDPDFSFVHHRMPVVLQNDSDVEKWINVISYPLKEMDPKDVFQSHVDCLNTHAVDRLVVNSTKNTGAICLIPLDIKPKSTLLTSWLTETAKTAENQGSPSNEESKKENKRKIKETFMDKWVKKPKLE